MTSAVASAASSSSSAGSNRMPWGGLARSEIEAGNSPRFRKVSAADARPSGPGRI